MELLFSIQSFLTETGGEFGLSWLNNWLPLSIIAVVTTILIHTTMLMFARAFSIKEIENFAMSELLQAAATAFMAIFLVAMISSAMEVAGTAIKGEVSCEGQTINIQPGIGAMDDAYRAILCRIQGRAREVSTIQGEILSDSGATFNGLNLAMSAFGITFFKGDWVTSLYKESETRRIVNNLATVVLIGLNAQSQLISYLRANMLEIFIPIGILLRSFYFTRGPGALMIALGIGMYFIFPVFFVLLDPGFTPAPKGLPTPIATVQPYCYATMTNAISVLTSIETAGLGSSSNLGLADLRNNLSKAYISLMLHPLVAFFLTMVFVRYMMSVLGGDTYELTKMVSKVV